MPGAGVSGVVVPGGGGGVTGPVPGAVFVVVPGVVTGSVFVVSPGFVPLSMPGVPGSTTTGLPLLVSGVVGGNVGASGPIGTLRSPQSFPFPGSLLMSLPVIGVTSLGMVEL